MVPVEEQLGKKLPSFAGGIPVEEAYGPLQEFMLGALSVKQSLSQDLGFLPTLWRVVCDCSNLQLELKDRIPFELLLQTAACVMGSLPSVVEEPTPEDNADFWSSALARDYVQQMAAATAEGNANWFRLCSVCGQQSYFRQNICLNPHCQLSFMHMSAEEVGARLQSWGAAGANQVATPGQLEAQARVKKIAQAIAASVAAPASAGASASAPNTGDGDGDGATRGGTKYYRARAGGGQKRKKWMHDVKQGRHPKTGRPMEWKKTWWKQDGKWHWMWEKVDAAAKASSAGAVPAPAADGHADASAKPSKAPPAKPPIAPPAPAKPSSALQQHQLMMMALEMLPRQSLRRHTTTVEDDAAINGPTFCSSSYGKQQLLFQ